MEICRMILISYSTLPPFISKNANATCVLIIWTSHQLVLSLLFLALLSLGQKPKQKDQLYERCVLKARPFWIARNFPKSFVFL